MPKCDLCWWEWTVRFVNQNWEEWYLCEDSAKKYLDKEVWVFYKWIIYEVGWPDVTRCRNCSKPMHREQYALQNWLCLSCKARREYMRNSDGWFWTHSDALYCIHCWGIHAKGMCPTGLHDDIQTHQTLSFSKNNECKEWKFKWDAVTKESLIKSIWQYQTERDLGNDEVELLGTFYRNTKKFIHYYTREPINIEWEVQYYNYDLLWKIFCKLDEVRCDSESDIKDCVKVPKYYNYYLKWLDENWLLKWQFIDIMWNVRERSEGINKFFTELWLDPDNSNMYCKFKYKLSSNIKHKVEAFKLNERVASCQKTGNYDSYARWAYDAITNGCNCPILIYTMSNKLIARITTRIMYDEQGQEYILIDRIYHNWEFSDTMMKWEIYKAIVKDLKEKGHKVIASPYSAHDKSTYAYLCSLWMTNVWTVTNLCQPLRRLIGNTWYYCDGWTDVFRWVVDWVERATDYLNKAYLF